MTAEDIIAILFFSLIIILFFGTIVACIIESIRYNNCFKKEPCKSYLELYKNHSKYSQIINDLWSRKHKIKDKIDSLIKEQVYLTPYKLYESCKEITNLKFEMEQLTKEYNIKFKLYSDLITEDFNKFTSTLSKKQLKKLYWFMKQYGDYIYREYVSEDKLKEIFGEYYEKRNRS